jgi:glycosyltransferase involved in cell wall biosynthesis
MKIAIFETEHFEGAFPVIKLFDMPGNQITILTSEETHKRFTDLFQENSARYQWQIISGPNKFSFFYSLYKSLKKLNPDILYINTISNNHLLYAKILWLLPVKRIVLTVHDINCLFESRSSRNFRKAVIHWGKRWLIKQVNEFNVVSDTMTSYLQTKTKQKKTHCIPGAVFEGNHSPQVMREPLRIVVPGSLDKRRRDYEQVFELAILADKEKVRLEIVLLGGYSDEYGAAIIERAATFHSNHCKMISYNINVVNQDEFDRQMNAAHFVFIPSVINTHICGDIPETYGITKSSGNIFDVIKHAKPFIVPSGLTISVNLQTSCYKYSSPADVIAFLKSFIHSQTDYNNWQEQALINSGNHTIEKVRERNASLFNGTAN